MCDNNFLSSLVASLLSWRFLAVSASYFLHAAINLRPPSVTVSTHISASNTVAFQPPATSNARMSFLYKNMVHSVSFPPHPLHTDTLKVSELDSLWRPGAAHSDEHPRPQKFFRAQRCLSALTPGHLEGTVCCTRTSGGLVPCAVPR